MSERIEALIARLEDGEQYADALDGPGGAIEALREMDRQLDAAAVERLKVDRDRRDAGENMAQDAGTILRLRRKVTALEFALRWALDYGSFDSAVDNALHARALDEARELIRNAR